MKKKLSILSLSLSGGGTERFIVHILPKLMEKYDVYLYFFFSDFHYKLPDGVTVKCFSERETLSRPTKLTSFIRISFEYYRFLKKYKIDTSLSFLPFPNFVNGLMNQLIPNLKCVLSERNFPTNMYQLNRAYSFLIPFFYNKADHLFSNSVHINQDLKENYKVNIPMDVIYNPVKKQPKMENKDSGVFQIINVGSFQPYRKNQLLLLKAGKILRNIIPFHINFYGDGHLIEELSNKANAFLLENQTTFHGKVHNIFEKYTCSNIFVLSSNSEGFPNVLLEAMSVGLPVISTNCMSGPLEILNDNEQIDIPKYEFVIAKHGIMINIDDDIALAKAIKYLYNDKEAYKSLSEKAYNRAQYYSLENVYESIFTLLNN